MTGPAWRMRVVAASLGLLAFLLCAGGTAARTSGSARLGCSTRADADCWCRPTVPLSGYPPVQALEGAESYGSDRRAEPFVLSVMQGAAAWRGLGDAGAARASVAEMRRWAEARALEHVVEVGPRRSNTNSVYSLRRALVGLLGSWSVLEASAGPEDRGIIGAWLGRLYALQDTDTGGLRGRGSPGAVSNRNNHAYLRASVDAYWAARTADRALVERAAAVVRRAVWDEMRPDGSLPLETSRGARALWYQRHAIASLVAVGEAVAAFGIDAWAPRPDGRSLHDAVSFLVAAAQDPSLVEGYAAADANPKPGTAPDRQDLGFLEPRGNGRHYMAWMEFYLRRFPSAPTSVALPDLVKPSLTAARPMIDDLVGGNATCATLAR